MSVYHLLAFRLLLKYNICFENLNKLKLLIYKYLFDKLQKLVNIGLI